LLSSTNTYLTSLPGISFKTQILYSVVFCARYLDLLIHYVSLYNSLMKVFFIGSAFYILYLMRIRFKATWDPSLDTFKIEYLLVPCGVLAFVVNYSFTPIEVCYCPTLPLQHLPRKKTTLFLDLLGVFCIFGSCCDSSTALPADTNRGSGDHHHTLSVCPRRVSCFVPSELDLSVYYR
jgi:hypothetical protein